MKKRGQINLKIIISIIVSLIVLFVLFLSFRSVQDIGDREASVEILNFKTSIETRILQQSVRQKGSVANFSVAVPSPVEKVCFFDANKEYNSLRNPEISGLFSEDKTNNLFILTSEAIFTYQVDKLEIPEEKNPLCAKIINNKVIFRLISKGEKTEIQTAEEIEDVKCVSVLENGEPEKKIDIVFLGYGFKNIEEYNNQVNRYTNNILLEFEPFNQYRNKFNFYRIDDAELECKISGFINCDRYKIKLAASDCPNDYIFVLVDRGVLKDIIKPVRSSAIVNIAKINIADKPFVLVHEFGHSFGDLADEYADESYYTDANFDAADYVNCDSSPCPTWQEIENTGCLKGCSLKKYYRPTKDSIMRSLSSPTYGPVNERELLKRLLFYE